MWKMKLSKEALSVIPNLKAAKLLNKAKSLLDILKENPFQNPPSYEKSSGNFSGMYSRRINQKHRLVYEIEEETKTVRVLYMWSHYEF